MNHSVTTRENPHVSRAQGSDLTETVLDLRDNKFELFTESGSVSIVIPVENNAAELRTLLPLIPAWVSEVVIVDAASSDDSLGVIRELVPGAIVLSATQPGMDQALRLGLAYATGDLIVALSGDGSMDPREIPAFIGALAAGADVAKGARYVQGGGTTSKSGRRVASDRFYTVAVNRTFRSRYSDASWGYFACRRTVLADLLGNRDATPTTKATDETQIDDAQITVRAEQMGLMVREVASFECVRTQAKISANTLPRRLRDLRTLRKERPKVQGLS